MQQQNEMPKWDVALEALMKEQSVKAGGTLVIEDLRQMAKEHGIRFDDIMDTLLIMCAEQTWEYQDASGMIRPISHDDIDTLFANGRLSDADVNAFTGRWVPCA